MYGKKGTLLEGAEREERWETEELGHLGAADREWKTTKQQIGAPSAGHCAAQPPSPPPMSWSQTLRALKRPISLETRKKKEEEKKSRTSGLMGGRSRDAGPEGPVLSHQHFAFSCRMTMRTAPLPAWNSVTSHCVAPWSAPVPLF